MLLFVNNIQWIVVALGNKPQDMVSIHNWWVRVSVLTLDSRTASPCGIIWFIYQMCLILKEWELWAVRWQRPKAECRTKIFYRHDVEQDGPLLSFLAAEKVIRKLVYGWGEKERPKSAHISCVKASSDAAAGALVNFGDAGLSPHSRRPSAKTRAWPRGLDSPPADGESKRQPSPSITEAKSLGYIRNLKSYESTGAERTSAPPPLPSHAETIHQHEGLQLERSGITLPPQLKTDITEPIGPDLASF